MYSLKRKIPYYNDLYVEEIKNLNNDKVDFFSVYTYEKKNHVACESTLTESFYEIFKNIQSSKNDVFMDCGSGLGHILYRASSLFDKIYGVEYHPDVYKIAKNNLEVLNVKNCTLINSDILDIDEKILDEVNVFYLFNLFTGDIFEKFISNIVASIKRRDRKVLIIYLNVQCKGMFEKYSDILPLHEIRMVRKPVHYYLHKSNGVKNG